MSGSVATLRTADYKYADPLPTCAHNYILPRIQHLLYERGPSTRLLDLGCGNGALMGHLERPDWEMYGIDGSVSGIERARLAHPSMHFHVSDITAPIEDLDCPIGYFDIVISTEVVEHVYGPRALASNAYKLLRPGGELIVTTPYHGYLKNLALAVTGQFDKHFTALWDGGHIKFWSRTTLTLLLAEAGFTSIKFYGVGRFPFLWKSMVMTAKRPTR